MHTAVTAYLDADTKYWDIQDDYDAPDHLKQLRALLATMQVCFHN